MHREKRSTNSLESGFGDNLLGIKNKKFKTGDLVSVKDSWRWSVNKDSLDILWASDSARGFPLIVIGESSRVRVIGRKNVHRDIEVLLPSACIAVLPTECLRLIKRHGRK
jgi:hypothetical protein